MKLTKLLFALFFTALFVTSCEDVEESILPKGDYENGIFVTNEGPFNSGTGTITFISDSFTSTETEVFKKVNNEEIGNILQSLTFNTDAAYLIVNNSHKIIKVDRYTFKKIGSTEENLKNPRYAVVVNGKLYVSNWGETSDELDDYIAVFNADNLAFETKIPVVLGPEKIEVIGDNIYVAHKGAWGYNNKISVISTLSNTIVTTIEVGDIPNSIDVDSNNNLWVLCGGKPSYSGSETFGKLVKINTSSNTVDTTFDFVNSHPSQLSIDDNNLFYQNNGKIFKTNNNITSLPTEPFLEVSGYSLKVHYNTLFVTDAKDFSGNGLLDVYDVSTKEKLYSLNTGIIPGGVYFN